MAIIITSVIIPNKPSGYFSSFNEKTFKPRRASSSTAAPAVMHCSLRETGVTCDMKTIKRRSGNYKPSHWDYDYVQSLSSEYSGERYLVQASELKAQMEMMLEGAREPVDQLQLIDDLQRLGISYHFEDKINKILRNIYEQRYLKSNVPSERDLYTVALEFGLLRQHGFEVSQDVFNCFKNGEGEFKSSLSNDTKGLLQLYEASHLLTEGEDTLELAREFATIYLQNNLDNEVYANDENLTLLVRYALELPLHWRIQRPNAWWFIHAYERKPDMNPIVLEFAKLDFNIVQATHQEELKHVSRWWKGTGLAEKLPFARDRLVECYFWTLGGFESQHGYSRIWATKVNVLITIIDDIYDIYGTLEEVQLFTDAIQRWDIAKMDELPDYMQMCYLALNNLTNEMAYDVLKDQGFIIIPYLRRAWIDLCKTYLQEAKWYFQGYIPTMEEYMNQAWISISAPVILSHAFFMVAKPIDKEAVQSLYKYHDLLQWSGMIVRLAGDLGTSRDEMKRGDVSKTIQCYMNETGATEAYAEEYARFLIYETWKKMNKEQHLQLPFPRNFIRLAVDLGRMAQYIYQHGDGHGIQNSEIKNETERGDVSKVILCYMNESGADKNDAQEYARFLIWKKMNTEQILQLPFPNNFFRYVADFGRMAQYMYQHGDGHGTQNSQIKDRIKTLLFEPIE